MIVQGPTRLSAPSRTQVDIDEAYARELQAQFDRETSIFRIAQRPHQRPVWPPSICTLYIHVYTLYVHSSLLLSLIYVPA